MIRGAPCYVMQYPSGRWGFVGTVPAVLAWKRRDGQPMTARDWHTVQHCMAPGSFGYGPATFATEEEARAALEAAAVPETWSGAVLQAGPL